jgi:hypothetical protein
MTDSRFTIDHIVVIFDASEIRFSEIAPEDFEPSCKTYPPKEYGDGNPASHQEWLQAKLKI